jgi:CheY-like chemotaxis protein
MQSKSILLIEDDSLDIISVNRSLLKIGGNHKLFTAYNGIEALAMLNEEEGYKMDPFPEIILLDLNMPIMNGVEFLKELRKNKKFDNIKIFVMTTSNEEKDRILMKDMGVTDYYIKPLNFTDNLKRKASMDSFMQFYISKILIGE